MFYTFITAILSSQKIFYLKKKKGGGGWILSFQENALYGFGEVTRLRSLKGVVITSGEAAEQTKLIYDPWYIWLVIVSSGGQCTLFLNFAWLGGFYTENWWGDELM